jgi:hypothetical protein
VDTYKSRIEQYERRQAMITWFGAGLLATFTALSTTKIFERANTPSFLVPFLITSIIITGVALGFARVGFEWEATKLRRKLDDGSVADREQLRPPEDQWPAQAERFWIFSLWTITVTGVIALVCAWWPFVAAHVSNPPITVQNDPTSEPTTPYIDLIGSATTHVPVLIALGFALIGLGVAIMALASTSGAKTAGAVLAITGSVMGSGAIFKDTKIESIFRLDKGAFEGLFKTLINVNGTLGPELIGSFPNFPLGATALDVESQDVHKEMRRVIDQWIAARKSGRNGVLMFVGSADRVPLAPQSRRQYEANAGIARARAESVRSQILEQTKELPETQRVKEEAALVLVSGPRRTPVVSSKDNQRAQAGFPEDRRVDVWAFWNTSSESSPRSSASAQDAKK